LKKIEKIEKIEKKSKKTKKNSVFLKKLSQKSKEMYLPWLFFLIFFLVIPFKNPENIPLDYLHFLDDVSELLCGPFRNVYFKHNYDIVEVF